MKQPRYFWFGGSDSSSDHGSFIIIVFADCPIAAHRMALAELTRKSRPDLIKAMGILKDFEPEPCTGIIYSSVQRSYKGLEIAQSELGNDQR